MIKLLVATVLFGAICILTNKQYKLVQNNSEGNLERWTMLLLVLLFMILIFWKND
jgi:hypothetical protein